ncbi:MAG: hypothetical protein AABZ14_06290 [Candidatus Margulisiibacteriota bacterium]
MRPIHLIRILLFSFTLSCIFAVMSDESWEKLRKNHALSRIITSDAQIHFNLAMTYAYTGFIEEGFKEIAMIPSLDMTFKEKALEKYAKRVARFPRSWEDHFYYAFALYVNEKKMEAVDQFKDVIQLASDPSIKGWASGYIAYIYGERKEWSQAMESITQAIRYEPDGATLYFAMALARKETGDTVGAAGAIIVATTLQAKQMLGSRSLARLRNEK